MALRRMVGKDKAGLPNVETVTDYPGHAVTDWRHAYGCGYKAENPDVRHDDCTPECAYMDPLYMETTHVGLVLSTGEVNGYDDSDFFATVWNPVARRTERITYASTRGWTYPNSATVDATPEVLAAVAQWEAERREAARVERAAREAQVPRVGTTVRVTGGRAVPKGTTATVAWFGEDRYYRPSRYANPMAALIRDTRMDVELGKYRVGLDVNGARMFVNAKHVEVVTATSDTASQPLTS